MFNEKPPKIEQNDVKEKEISLYSERELLQLRARIDAMLPVKLLKDLDMEHEMVMQYRATKLLQDEVLEDEDIPANQKAQVVNACAGALETLVTMQTKHNTASRMKEIESILIDVMNAQPKEVAEAFFEMYRERLEAAV